MVNLEKRNSVKEKLLKAFFIGVGVLGLSSFVSSAPGIFLTTNNGSKVNLQSKTIVVDGSLKNAFSTSATWKLLDMESSTQYPNGVTINSIYVKASVADPTTELNANIMRCDAQGTGAFPGANPTLITAIDTTAGNYSNANVNVGVPTNKIIYLLIDADPTDSITWSITINFTVN